MNERNALRPMPALCASVAALFLFGLQAPGFAQSVKPPLKALDVFDLQWVGDPEVSPDGRSVAYVRKSFDIKTDHPRGVVWLVGSDGAHARPLSSAASSAAPRWSPDGTRIAYLGKEA